MIKIIKKLLNISGWIFDLISFLIQNFEILMYKLLTDYFKEKEYVVKSQYSMHNMFAYTPGFNPQHPKSPAPRPDFALFKVLL